MPSVLATVTEAESKVVDAVRRIQQPLVGYVRKGVELADARLPDLRYPESLPRPGEVVDSQFDFIRSLVDAQHDLVKAVVEALAPLAEADTGSEAAEADGDAKGRSRARGGRPARSRA